MSPHVESILQYLSRAEWAEIDPWLRDDLRIAWLTVLYANRGAAEPFVLASYRVLGIHPDKLQAAIDDRRRSQLGRMYDQVMLDLPARKPTRSDRRRLGSKRESGVRHDAQPRRKA